MNDQRKDIGLRLLKMRRRRGLSQLATAQRIGFSQEAYCAWENGKRYPNGEALIELANLFVCTTDYLLLGK